MSTELPDLVIRGIFLHYMLPKDNLGNFKKNLSLLNVCSIWRYLGLPIAYRAVCIEDGHSNVKGPVKLLNSNIELVAELGLEHLVKRFELSLMNDSSDFARILGPFFNHLNLGNVDWPDEYGLQLIGRIVDRDESNYWEQSLSDGLFGKMSTVLQTFAERFPGIKSIDIFLTCARGTARQLNNQLIKSFSHRLEDLKLIVETPINLDYFPSSLKRLKFIINRFTGYPLPGIRNHSELQSLDLEWLEHNCYWEDLLEMPTGDQPFVFSNLRALFINYEKHWLYDNTYEITPNDGPRSLPARRISQVHFPQLRRLTFYQPSGSGGYLVFNPEVISSHLENVNLELELKELEIFSKLPIEYIRHFNVSFYFDEHQHIGIFYAVTSRMFGEMGNVKGTTTVTLMNDRLDFDMEQIRWDNVTKLRIQSLKPSMLLPLVSRMPLVSWVEVGRLEYGSFEYIDMLSNAIIKGVDFRALGDSWSLDEAAEYIAYILKQFSHIKDLVLPKHLMERVEDMVQNANPGISLKETERIGLFWN